MYIHIGNSIYPKAKVKNMEHRAYLVGRLKLYIAPLLIDGHAYWSDNIAIMTSELVDGVNIKLLQGLRNRVIFKHELPNILYNG